MSKKNKGATIGVLVAVSIGATAYASTMGNLDKDTNTKALLKDNVSYVEPDYASNLESVDSDYTKEVVNTKIGESEKDLATDEVKNEASLYESVSNFVEDKVSREDTDNSQEVKEADDKQEVVEEKPQVVEQAEVNEDYENTKTVADLSVDKYVGVEYLNVRASADMNSDVITTIKAGDKVTGTLEGQWVNTGNGYVSSTYLQNSYPQALVDQIKAREEEEAAAREAEAKKQAEEAAAKEAEAKKQAEEAAKKAQAEKEAQEKAEKEAQEKAEKEEAKRQAEEAAKKAQAEKEAKEKAAKEAEAKRQAEEAAKKAQAAKTQSQSQTSTASQAVAYTGWVNTSYLNVRTYPSTNGTIVGSVTKGDKISGTLQNGWVKFTSNGRTVYVSASYLVNYAVAKPVRTQTSTTTKQTSTQASSNSQQTQSQTKTSTTTNTAKSYNSATTTSTTSGSGQAVANIAQKFAGYSYVYGSANPSVGFDCSGLVYYAYQQVGVTLSRNSAAQFSNGYSVSLNNLKPGDLVFFSYSGNVIDHVGMITGYDGTFIHASTPSTGVVYGNIYSSHYQSVFKGARRIF